MTPMSFTPGRPAPCLADLGFLGGGCHRHSLSAYPQLADILSPRRWFCRALLFERRCWIRDGSQRYGSGARRLPPPVAASRDGSRRRKAESAVGAISGPGPWLLIFVASSLIGGVVGLALAARHGRLGSTLHNTAFVAGELLQLRAPWRGRPALDVQHQDALRMPHGAIIAVAVILLAATGLV